ncbi:hypothetical protein SAMN05877838_0890 [Hoeflea halophila]|uniref:Uncharacterized protein n=1 Tax=Hoeflea halophila TaxID=714899 RepID=A0A286HY15_9HYPH|nr:hypothetical protein SAMN05877838_0890 [Hoeflea halophila]
MWWPSSLLSAYGNMLWHLMFPGAAAYGKPAENHTTSENEKGPDAKCPGLFIGRGQVIDPPAVWLSAYL